MKKELISAYEIIEERKIEDLDSYGTLLRHKKTGAKVMILENDDDNKVFYIGFRTPPADSTGVAHIVEHTVLCGSDLFPLKDPFVELAKGSLNTFLNAMTYPDKTVYPVASCNDSDFKNLMHVYLDAVFHPNIYKEEKIFQQEGWHYELEDEGSELRINGVVYNEMKGAFSSPDDVLDREVFNSLYPDTAYGVESGGDPDVIPELTYEGFLDFHSKYYHPSNSYIYLYGNCDMAERLQFIDEQYLSGYDKISVNSLPGTQKPFDECRKIHKYYPVSEEESLEGNTYLSYNAVVSTSLDAQLYLAFQAIEYALVEAPGTPLKQALTDAKIGTEIYATYENGIYQPYFSVVAKNADASQEGEFLRIIRETLQKVCRDGFDSNALLAALNTMEFRYRESDFGTNPRGLILGLQAFDSWLYEETQPFMHIECNASFASLRQKIGTGYFEKLVQEYLLDNPHKSVVVIEPKKGLSSEKEQQLAAKLEAYKNSLPKEELDKLIQATKDLKGYQEEPESEEALKTIPRLKRCDLETSAKPLVNELRTEQGVPVLVHDIFTNGIAYIRLMFRLEGIPAEYMPYVTLLKNALGYMDTEEHSYEQLGYEINIKTGGLSFTTSNFMKEDEADPFASYFVIKAKSFTASVPDVLRLSEEILEHTKLGDKKRLKEILNESLSRLQAKIMSSGHSAAALRALSYLSEIGQIMESTGGIAFYHFLEQLVADFDERAEETVTKMQELLHYIFRKENLLVDFAGQEAEYGLLRENLPAFVGKLFTDKVSLSGSGVTFSKKNEGLMTSSQVQYVCRAGNFAKKGFAYTGALRVLRVILGYEYLWLNVRVKGGAYGCMSSFGRNGESYFVSYRDPNLKETVDVFEQAVSYLKEFRADEDTMTKFIIGTLSDMDIPLTPSTKAERSMTAYLSEIPLERLQKERDQVLAATDEDIRALAAYVQAFLSDDCLCVLGGEEKIKENKDLFDKVVTLFH